MIDEERTGLGLGFNEMREAGAELLVGWAGLQPEAQTWKFGTGCSPAQPTNNSAPATIDPLSVARSLAFFLF